MVVAVIFVLALAGQLGTSVFGWLGTIGLLALLLVYLLTQIAAVKLLGSIGRWRGRQFAILGRAVILLAYTRGPTSVACPPPQAIPPTVFL